MEKTVAELPLYPPSGHQGLPSLATSDVFGELDPNAIRIYDLYRRASEIYHRAEVAMGREPKFTIVVSNATHVRVGHEQLPAPKISYP